MKEKLLCIVTPGNRTYYKAVAVAKEFLDKDQNIVHAIGKIPDGECDEVKVSTKTVKHYKNSKLDGELTMVDLNTNAVTFTEQYKDGILVDVEDHTARNFTVPLQKTGPAKTYEGTSVKTNKNTLSFYVNGKEVAEQTVAPDGTILEQLNNVPDGPVKEFDENGTLRLETNYHNNRPEGALIRYDETGQIISQENYVQGKLNGPAEYYSYHMQGKNTVKANYKNALLEGDWTLLLPDGKVFIKAIYQNGKLQGPYTMLYTNGQTNIQENYEKGKLNGQRQVFFPDGHLWYLEHYKEGRLDGDRFCFFTNGNKFLEEFYTEGLLEGPRKIYAENGELLTNEEYHWGTLLHNTERK